MSFRKYPQALIFWMHESNHSTQLLSSSPISHQLYVCISEDSYQHNVKVGAVHLWDILSLPPFPQPSCPPKSLNTLKLPPLSHQTLLLERTHTCHLYFGMIIFLSRTFGLQAQWEVFPWYPSEDHSTVNEEMGRRGFSVTLKWYLLKWCFSKHGLRPLSIRLTQCTD